MRSVYAGLAALSLGLAACSEVPEGMTEADVRAFEEAAATIGCQLVGESDYSAVEFQAGLTREQALKITERKLSLEQAVRMPEGGVRLVSGPCAA